MRRIITACVLALLALGGTAQAQQQCNGCGIGYWYAGLPLAGGTMTGPLVVPGGSVTTPGLQLASPAAGLYLDTTSVVVKAAGHVLFTASAGGVAPFSDDAYYSGLAGARWKYVYVSQGVMGSRSKALSDNVATAFVRVAIAQTAGANYTGGQVLYTIFCKDASNQATLTGTVKFACHNLAGTESCGFSVPDGVTLSDGTANFVAPVFSAVSNSADTIDLYVKSDCSGVTPTTHTVEYRLDMPKPATTTPQ